MIKKKPKIKSLVKGKRLLMVHVIVTLQCNLLPFSIHSKYDILALFTGVKASLLLVLPFNSEHF